MNRTRVKILRIAWCALLLSIASVSSAQELQSDTLETAFRKGRWWLGIAGGFSSGIVRTDSTSQGDFVNEYNLDMSAGKFIADKWLLGAVFRAQRDGASHDFDRETELFFVGPSASFFFSRSPVGSVYIQAAPGYSRFRDVFVDELNGTEVNTEITGQGIGVLATFGYALVIRDVVSFNLGFNYSTNWIEATRRVDPGDLVTKENFRVGNVSFLFGFNVIL